MRWRFGRVLSSVLHRVSSLLVFPDAVQMVGDTSFRHCSQRRIDASVKAVLFNDRIEGAAFQSLPSSVSIVTGGNGAEDSFKESTRPFLHDAGNRSILVVAVNVPADSTSAEESSTDQRRYHA